MQNDISKHCTKSQKCSSKITKVTKSQSLHKCGTSTTDNNYDTNPPRLIVSSKWNFVETKMSLLTHERFSLCPDSPRISRSTLAKGNRGQKIKLPEQNGCHKNHAWGTIVNTPNVKWNVIHNFYCSTENYGAKKLNFCGSITYQYTWNATIRGLGLGALRVGVNGAWV